jgi:hypothetical protein
MATFPIYAVAKCVSCPDSSIVLNKPFFILETYLTLDGPRTRMCNGRWGTQEQAEAALKEKMSK